MAKFRFPGKALKLNTRKRVRFRGGHAANTPEELYTRRIRRGLDLFTQIFGDSDEDDDEFEGFTSIFPEPRDVKGKKKKSAVSPRKKSGKRSPTERAEEACVALEEAGLVTRRKVSTVEMAIKEVQDKSDVVENVPVVTRRRGGGGGDTAPGKEVREGPGGGKEVVASTRRRTSNVELPVKEVSEGVESSTNLPVVTRRRVSGVETPMRDLVKEGGAENSKDPPMVTRRRGHSLEGVVKEAQEGSDNVPAGGERTSEKRDLTPQPASKENVERVVHSEQPIEESSAALQGMRMAVMSSRQVARKQTARRVSRPSSTVKTVLARKLLARAKAKRTVNSLPVVGEKSPKRFVLPSMSVRSSRIIKPNKRLFADITEMCTASSSLESSVGGEVAEHVSMPSKRLVKLTRKGRGAHTQFLSLPRSRAQSTDSLSSTEGGVGRDRMRRTISLYTESITGPSKAQVGRPPKRLLRRMDPPQQEVEAELPESPQRCDPKESRVMEKIGKLLRSPWDDRLKQSSKGGRGEEDSMPASAFGASSTMSASAISRNILRKARLNLNKTTLQKIRNPVSLQRLIPASAEGVEGKCAVCDSEEGGNSRKFGVIVCEKCNSFISNSSDGSREVYECKDNKAECQVQELVEGRCNACWLGRILHVCSMPNLLHDRLRKRLPNILKEQIPTSLARCMSGGSLPTVSEKDAELATHTKRLPLDPGGGGAFGSVMDLPGGWKRKTGSEVIVISPSGEKFKSIQKLEEFLKKQGITTDARVLFGNSSPAVVRSNEPKSRPSQATNNSSRGKVVMTTLPGGWVRRIKWRSAGDRFDTYVYSPDGRTFRSRRELSAYFQLIGKVDDIHKYFPVVTGHSDASIPSSSDTTGSSSTERLSSSEPCSEISSDDKSPEASECETEASQSRLRKLSRNAKEKVKFARLKQTKVKNHKEGHLRSKSVSSLKSVKFADKKSEMQMDMNISAEGKAAEKKYKKPKIVVRSRSLSLGRKKGDASLTDTTESESENRNSGKGFAKTFSKRLKGKPKPAVSGLSPTIKPLSASSNNASEDSGKMTPPSASVASPQEVVEESEELKLEETIDDAAVFIKPDDVPKEKQSEQGKIVLKIQKKSIETVDRRHRHKNKKDKRKKGLSVEEPGSLSKEQVAQSGAEAVQNMTAEKVLAQLSSTSKSSEDAKEKLFSMNSEDLEKDLVDGESDTLARLEVSDDSKLSSPMASESEPIHETTKVPEAKPKSKPKKPSSYQTSHFGGGWSRKIKWNEKGEGKVALLHSPDGQTFRSRIELLAYFKKAGKSKGNLDYYFPPVLKREDYNEPEKKQLKAAAAESASALGISTSGQSSEVSEFSDSEIPKTSEDSCVSGEEGMKRSITKVVKCYRRVGGQASLKSIPENVSEDSMAAQIACGKGMAAGSLSEEAWKHGSQLGKTGRKDAFAAGTDSKQTVKSESEELEGAHPEVGGPRVKHVCRSQAQVLGIPRAVFPSPGKDEDKAPMKVIVPSSKSDKKRKIVTVTTTASGKVLRKTQWCNKCPGCTTPNCRKCVNCLDMKKYGGPGTKKKPCIMRKCHNPRLSIKSAISQEGTAKVPVQMAATNTSTAVFKEVRKVPPTIIKVQEEKILPAETSGDQVLKAFQQEKAVFVPRQMTRSQPDQKDRGDIAAGKQFVPGTLVNIDYWQGYDADEMMLTGYPVITASSQHPQILCFRCGSLGKEQLLYCAWCCEGVHPYCLEDGEGPESEVEEAFWICRRCAVCHVCGAPGADSLLRCSDCRNYYHMECLGPSAHSTCQPPPDRPWKCVRCTRCTSCGSPNVAQWLEIPCKAGLLTLPGGVSPLTVDLALCVRCITLRERGNFCPLCNGCYEDDDYDSKMMECGRCGEWIHAHCEGLNNERYQILSFLPDTVEYVCRSCVTESTSTWLHAVSSELMAGCEAVLQALIASRCAKHLVKREASSKVSSSGGLTPLPCLPEVGSSIQARIDDALVERVEGLDALLPATSTNTVAVESHSTTTSAESNTGEVSPLSGSNVCVSMTTVAAGDRYVSSTLEGTSSSSDTSHIVGSVDDLGVGAPQTSRKSDDCSVDTNKDFSASLCSVIVNRTDIPQEGAGESSKQSEDQVACFSDNQSENVAANKNTGKSGCITVAKDKSDLKGKPSKEKSADEPKAFSRRQTRSSSGAIMHLSPTVGIGNAADPIKLKECSVRLEDICKARSPSSSPMKTHQSELENVPVVEEEKKTEETSKSQETIVEDTLIKDRDERTAEALESLEDKEFERVTRDTLQGILALKDTDVSCTQVDGPNDETTATARVIRNLFFEDRSQMMLDTTSLLESKTKVDEKNLAHVEAQLISPKDKITKDIDDDCVSSEESSYCDTDTEIESIQDDPEEPRDLISVKEKLRERKYDSVLQFHVDMVRVIENGRHLNRSQTRNVQVTYTKHMKECFPWFDIKTANVFELVDKQRPFPLPHWDHSYVYRPMLSGTRIFSVRDVPLYRKRSTSPLKSAQISPPDRRKCVLCGREGDDEPNAAGRLLYLGQDEWMHVNCGLWSSEVYEEVDGGLQNIYLAVSRGRLIKCSACSERGATVGCCHKSCQATYHFLCARKACCQFMEDKRIFCPLHESTSNGEEKTDDFKVSRCVYVDMDSEKKKWKQVAGNRVSIIIGSLTIKNVGRIVPESDSAEALIPLDFSCSRVYWSTVDPSKKVTYTCRTKRVVPAFDDSTLVGDAAFHRTIDHSLGEEAVTKEMAAVRKWFKQLEERKVEKKSRETNIIPPHLCPLYRSIREREQETRVVEKIVRCRTPPAIVELDVRQCIDDIIDRVSRSVEEESLLLDTDLPAIVSADDNELISMVLNDLDACDSITLQSTPSTSGRPSPLDIDFLSTCDHMMDSGKVSHSGNLTQEAQETECDPQGIMDAASLSPRLHPTLAAGIDPIHETYQVESPNADVKEPIIETIAPPSMQDLGSVPSSSTKSLQSTCNSSQNMSASGNRSSSGSNTTSSCSTCSSESKCSTSSSNSSSSSSSSCSTAEESSSPERCPAGTTSTSSSPDSCSRVNSDNSVSNDSNNGSTDSNSGSESSSQSASGSNQSPTAIASGKTNSLKQICRVLPMPSTNSRRSSSASEHSDAIGHAGHNHSPPASNQSPRNSDENEGNSTAGRGNERKKICMKRNYKTVIKKYPLRSGMRKSKPYETVQIEINETIEIPGGEGSGMVRKSLKRKWSGILDSEEEEDNNQKETGVDQEGQEETTNRSSDGENSKENSVSKKVLKFSDDNNDITVSIVNNNNLCEFSKSRVHKYRHKTVLQLDGAADGSSSSAEMSESQDEGTGEERRRLQEQEDPQTPPLHSALAMRIKEQSLARSSPGEEGPYKCGKCKRLYRTKESYQKHIETCTFEVDSSSTSEDEEYEEVHIEEEEEGIPSALPQLQEEKLEEVIQEDIHLPSLTEREEYPPISQHNAHVAPLLSQDAMLPNTSSNQLPDIDITAQSADDPKHSVAVDFEGHARPTGEEPAIKRARLDATLPRQHGVHRQVRTAIKKSQSTTEDVELLQVVRGPPPPGSDVFVPPPVSPVKFSPVVKKSASPRRYTNVRLLRGSRGYQYRRAAPHLPAPHEHYQGTNSGVQMTPSAPPTPIQVAMHPMTNNSGQNLAQGALAAFQQFPGQSNQYTGTPQLTSSVTHLTSAVQVTPQVTSQVAPQVSPQVSPQVLTMVSAPSVAVPQGYTLQYVGSFRDGEVAAGGGGLVTYPAAPVVVPQPQLVMTPQQSSVVVPQVVNTNITYTFTAPETLVINQPAMVPGMQSVQYLPQQQQQQQQQPQVIHHPEQQVGTVMQYNQTGVSPQQVPVSHMHTGQVHTPCMPYSDIQASPICMQPHAQTAIVTRELSFTGGGSKQLQSAPCVGTSQNRTSHGISVNLPVTSPCSGPIARHRPQASVAPQVIQPQPALTTSSSDVNLPESQGHSRLPFSDRPLTGVVRTVATVAPAIITTTTMVSLSTCSSATRLTSMDTSPKVATVRPRPTYSYRDAMREKQLERQKQRQEVLQLDRVNISDPHHDFLKEREGLDVNISDSETDSETETTSHDAEKEKDDHLETQSYKLVLRKDSSTSTGFNVLPISGPTTPLPSPEVKELRIKAKVSVGPKRKKAKSRDPEKDLIIVNKDTSSDLYVNEQLPNFSVNPMHNPADDPAMFDKPKACSAEPYIVFELTSEDGFRVESRHIAEVWQKVFDAVAAARASMRMDPKVPHNIQQPSNPGDSISGLHMLGLTHNAVQYLLEQLPGAKDCHKYSFQFHRRPQEEGAVEENPTGCARTEPFKTRSPYDIFSWLASKHRRMPERSLVQQEEIQLSTTRRATSLELPMAMRYRHLRETAREAVGVFRSSIHGRGLFCKRDIDAGEMVIEYAGQVIRSSLCDMREKDYESKGIGCYMFRIDDDTVIDATMHGNAARFINHSCDPNCYSRVVDILGKKHIIIFALRRILRGEELTYDYKFPIEEDKIPCTCGTRRCRKYLN